MGKGLPMLRTNCQAAPKIINSTHFQFTTAPAIFGKPLLFIVSYEEKKPHFQARVVQVANPYHSWERDANENINKLIKQYFPKEMSFETITNQQVEYPPQVEKLNNRPRKKLNFFSPNGFFNTFADIFSQNASCISDQLCFMCVIS